MSIKIYCYDYPTIRIKILQIGDDILGSKLFKSKN
jgi:hypothetical protein